MPISKLKRGSDNDHPWMYKELLENHSTTRYPEVMISSLERIVILYFSMVSFEDSLRREGNII